MRAKLKRVQNARGPHAINPTTPTQGHFVLSPVSLASRDQDDGPVEQNDQHLRSHGKIGDCEQSTATLTSVYFKLSWPIVVVN